MVSWVSCGPCSGSGSVFRYDRRKCDDCDGRGYVNDFQQPWHNPNSGPQQPGYKPCGGCGSSGLKGGNYPFDCTRCNGRGATLEHDEPEAQDTGRPTPGPLREPRPPSPPPIEEPFRPNAFAKAVFFLIKAGLAYLVFMWVLRISVVNNVMQRVPGWWAHSAAKEEIQKIAAGLGADARAPAKAVGYPPAKGVWVGRVECGKTKGEARLTLNGPMSDRVEAPLQIKWEGATHGSKHAIKLEGRIVNDKLHLEGSGSFGNEGYYAAQVVVDFEAFRPTTAAGTLGAPGCEASRLALRREQ